MTSSNRRGADSTSSERMPQNGLSDGSSGAVMTGGTESKALRHLGEQGVDTRQALLAVAYAPLAD